MSSSSPNITVVTASLSTCTSGVAAPCGGPSGMSGPTPAALGTTYKNRVPQAQTSARAERFVLQAAARDLLPDKRVAWCLRRPLPDCKTVDVMYSDERQRAYYANLMTCQKVWECAVCAARITEQRREMLVDLMTGSCFQFCLVTYTVQHTREQSCAEVLDLLGKAHRRFKSGRWYQGFKARFRVLETCKSLELTHGDDNGWHGHCHEMVVGDSVWTGRQKLEMLAMGKSKWAGCVEAVGGYASLAHGFDVIFDDQTPEDFARYMLKQGHVEDEYKIAMAALDAGYSPPRWGPAEELTKAGVKRARDGNRSMVDLLRAYAFRGDLRAGMLWVEAVGALSGRKQLAPSRGFWKLLGRDDRSDAELAEIVVGPLDRVLAALPLIEWRKILKQDKRAEVLAVADSGDLVGLLNYLGAIGIDVKRVEVLAVADSGDVGL